MPAQFKANVEETQNKDSWFIRLTDIEMEKEAICRDMKDFSQKLEEMADEYGGDIEVNWSKNDDVSDEHFYELHQEMAKLKEELEV